MDVTHWRTPAEFFPWRHVQKHIDGIEYAFRTSWIEFTQAEFHGATPCPKCARPVAELFWFSIADPEPAWDAGSGRVGFLTLCQRCHVQVEFLLDQELTDMQADQWRKCRTLS